MVSQVVKHPTSSGTIIEDKTVKRLRIVKLVYSASAFINRSGSALEDRPPASCSLDA